MIFSVYVLYGSLIRAVSPDYLLCEGLGEKNGKRLAGFLCIGYDVEGLVHGIDIDINLDPVYFLDNGKQ